MWVISKPLQFQTALLLTVVQFASGGITLTANPPLPEMHQNVTISCYSTKQARTLFHNGEFISGCNNMKCMPEGHPERGYTYTADDEKAEVTISSLNRTRDQGQWICSASNNRSITLVIYSFPRGLSFINGWETEEDLAKSQVTLQCQTDGCTYPCPNIRWYYKDVRSPTRHTFSEATYTHQKVTEGNCTRPENTYKSTLTLPIYMTWSDNSDKTFTFSCGIEYSTSSRNVYSPESKEIRFAVSVSEVQLQLNSQPVPDNSSLTVISGELVTMNCVPGTSRPDPTIEWYIGSQMKNVSTSQTYIFTPGNEDHDKVIYCRVYNIKHIRAVESNKPKLYVKVVVTSVDVSLSTSKEVFYEGYPKTLTCTSSPSRPIPTIRWFLNDTLLTDNINITITIDVTGLHTLTSYIFLSLVRGDMNRTLYCDGFTDNQTAVSSSRHTVKVWYKPNKPEVKIYGEKNDRFPWLENNTGTLECYSSDYGNPSSRVTWISEKVYPGMSKNLLITRLVHSDHDQKVSCKLDNIFTNYTKDQVISEPLRLNVEYHPIIWFNSSSSITANETQSLYVLCEAKGNPNPNVTRWKDRQIGSVLIFDNISRHDTGTYICEATANSTKYGTLTTQMQLDIIVQYSPDIKINLSGSTLQNETAVLVCEARGVPSENTFYPWVHMWRNNVIRKGLHGINNSTHSTLNINRLSLENTGTYTCNSTNGVTGVNGKFEQTGSIYLHVTGIPNILRKNSIFAGEIGRSVNITVPFYGYPAIESFNIQRKGIPLANTSNINTYLSHEAIDYQMYGTTVQFGAQMAYLVIKTLSKVDFDNYTLVLENVVGHRKFTFQLEPVVMEKEHKQGNATRDKVIAGIVSVVVFVAVIAGIIICQKRKSDRKKASDEQPQDIELLNRRRHDIAADCYENLPVRNDHGNLDNIYENVLGLERVGTAVHFDDANVYENRPAQDRNLQRSKGSLIYADLELENPKTNNGKPIIHGLENRTEYAEIAFGKLGMPLPDSNDE